MKGDGILDELNHLGGNAGKKGEGQRLVGTGLLARFGLLAMALCLAFGSLAVSSTESFAKPTVNGVRVGDHASKTRFVLDLSEKVGYSIFVLPDPYRVVIDLPELTWNAPVMSRPKADRTIKDYRFGLYSAGNARVVLDLQKPALVHKAFLLPPGGGAGWRFVVDLKPASRADFVAARSKKISGGGGVEASLQQAAAPKPVQQPKSEPKSNAKPVIVIDAGHGGVDPGATGISGVHEKHITLKMAKQLRAALKKTGRYKVVLTRERDIFIPLRKRVEIARQAGADLFISLHADAIKSPRIRGLSVYTLSEKSSDQEAHMLAERENKADLLAGLDLSGETKEVTDILIDLAQRETMNLSARYANFAVRELRRNVKLLRRSHRFAGFAVLKAPDVPSVLVEMGYLSNREDERNLRREDYRAKLAKSLIKAIDGYFAQTQKAYRP